MSHNQAGYEVVQSFALRARRARRETLPTFDVTELEPANGVFAGKRIDHTGRILPYPSVLWWRQRLVRVPAAIPQLFGYLCEARRRNVILIRGAPADPTRPQTRRWRAGVVGSFDRGRHGFDDAPSILFPLDIDGAAIAWRADPEMAVKRAVAQLGEPWASTAFVWFFTTKHGLETGDDGRWSGGIVDGTMRVRVVFLADRPLDESEALALTRIAQARVPFTLDPAIVRRVQPNYIRRPLWTSHPDRDVLDGIPTIGWIAGTRERLAVPVELAHEARWAKAQGLDVEIADHPDAETAVRSIGNDGRIRPHLMSAVVHLLQANPVPEVVSFADHSIAIAGQLAGMVRRHQSGICTNLASNGRKWADVEHYLPENMVDWARWLLDNPSRHQRKTIELAREEFAEVITAAERETLFAKVERSAEHACQGAATDDPLEALETPPVTLLVAPAGTRKSTHQRSQAVRYVSTHPGKSAVIFTPRHSLNDEQLAMLRAEHGAAGSGAIWRGRLAEDPGFIGPQRGERRQMCWRPDEVKALQAEGLDVDRHLCRQIHEGAAVKCPIYDRCGYQRMRKRKGVRLWLAAHETLTHEKPPAFGDVGLVLIDESALDAFVFGTDNNDLVTIELDTLRTPPARRFSGRDQLIAGREKLYRLLDALPVPDDPHLGTAVTAAMLAVFRKGKPFTRQVDASLMRLLELKAKVVPEIRPNMSADEVQAILLRSGGNAQVLKLALLWQLVENGGDGNIQLHRGMEGRVIRMVGRREVAKGWRTRTLICDATGDGGLLAPIWPQLQEEQVLDGWQQLPRPTCVRTFQCVDKAIAKQAVGIEGGVDKRLPKIFNARRLWGSVLAKAAGYGGEAVGVIMYKSTRDWIEKNCHVPPWVKLVHHGDVTGSNALQKVRALFVIGRLLPSAESVTRQAEALTGRYIRQRAYQLRKKGGTIPIVPDVAGNNAVKVDVWAHPDPTAELLRRQVTEAGLIQAVERARAGLRAADEPLDIWLLTDVPLPELGPVVPVLWDELNAGLDGIMLAAGGVWLESISDAAEAYAGLLSVDALKKAKGRGGGTIPIVYTIGNVPPPHHFITYQRTGKGQRPARAVSLLDLATTQAWLEARLGSLVRFEVTPAD